MNDVESTNVKPNNQPFSQEGYDLMGACFEVHRELGGGLAEEIYQESLEWELSLRGMAYVAKDRLFVWYKDHQLTTRYVPDLMIVNQIVVELKSVKTLLPEHESQLFNYLRIARKPVGYLVNFAPQEALQWKRFVLSQFLPSGDVDR